MSKERRRVLVTGGAGFIASHVSEAYLAQGDEVWIVDNLSSGKRANVPEGAHFVEMDVRDPDIRKLFLEVRPDLVNHHAAQIDVRASVLALVADLTVDDVDHWAAGAQLKSTNLFMPRIAHRGTWDLADPLSTQLARQVSQVHG